MTLSDRVDALAERIAAEVKSKVPKNWVARSQNENGQHYLEWAPIAEMRVPGQWLNGTVMLTLLGAGSGDALPNSANLTWRVKQQDPMGQPPRGSVVVGDLTALRAEDFVSVIVQNDATATVARLYVRARVSWDTYNFYERTAALDGVTLTYLDYQPWTANLPAGLQHVGTEQTSAPSATTYAATLGHDHADFIANAPDVTSVFQAAIDRVAGLETGGVLFVKAGYYTCGTVILRRKVSLQFEKGAQVTLANGAGQFLVSEDFATSAGSGNSWAGVSGIVIDGLTIEGNSANQPASGATNYRGRNALIKLYGWNLTLRNLRLNNAKEIALYTEHDYDWNGENFNEYQFGESVFSNIKVKNYGVAGWVNRGPHDSHLTSVYLSSYNASGLTAANGYVGQLSTAAGQAYGSQGTVVDNLHVWGEHSDSAVLLDGANITQGKLYAEGATVAAIRITAASIANHFEAVVGFSPIGVILEGSNDHHLSLYVESNITASLFQVRGSSSGCILTTLRGAAYGTNAALFDLTSGYTGGNNTFTSARAWASPLFRGTPAASDRIDVVSDNWPDWDRQTRWELPVGDRKLIITNAGANFGGLPLSNAPHTHPGATVVVHGDDPNVARPDTTGAVVWFGTVDPVNSDDARDVTVPVVAAGTEPAGGTGGGTVDYSNLEGIVFHDGTAGGGTRLTGYKRVRWVGGTVRPTNMAAGDVWERDA